MATSEQGPIVGILVGGGPAPGINSVIGAATIRSILGGCEVIGIQDGFKWIMQGNTSKVRRLSIEDISRIHFSGGSCLGTARANPTQKAEQLDACLASLQQLGVTRLITIGGDDTAFSALKLEQRASGRLQVVHVPKLFRKNFARNPSDCRRSSIFSWPPASSGSAPAGRTGSRSWPKAWWKFSISKI